MLALKVTGNWKKPSLQKLLLLERLRVCWLRSCFVNKFCVFLWWIMAPKLNFPLWGEKAFFSVQSIDKPVDSFAKKKLGEKVFAATKIYKLFLYRVCSRSSKNKVRAFSTGFHLFENTIPSKIWWWGPHCTMDSVLASHPAAPGSNLRFYESFWQNLGRNNSM